MNRKRSRNQKSLKKQERDEKPELVLWAQEDSLSTRKSKFKDFVQENWKGVKVSAWTTVDCGRADNAYVPRGTKEDFRFYSTISEIPEDERDLVQKIETFLQMPHQSLMSIKLKQLIVRRSEGSFILVVQTGGGSSTLTRARKRFVKFLEGDKRVAGVHLVELSPEQIFRLDGGAIRARISQRKLSGSNWISRTFSVNNSEEKLLLDPIERAFPPELQQEYTSRMLTAINPKPTDRLLHLYSSSAQESLLMQESFQHIDCVEARKTCLESIRKNQKFVEGSKKERKIDFHNQKVDADKLGKMVNENSAPKTTVLLTPPSQLNVPPALIRKLTELQVGRVARVYSDGLVFQEELKKWKQNDYIIRKILPIHFTDAKFPLVIVLLAPDREEVLKNRRKAKAKEDPRKGQDSGSKLRYVQT